VSRAAVPVFLLLTLTAHGAPDRIAGAIDPNRTSVLRGQVHRLAQARYDQGLADPAMELRYVTLFLQPAPGLEAFLGAQRPNNKLAPEDFADRFGLSQNDIGKLAAWLGSQGLRVNDVARGRHWITFSGTAERVGRALHTEIHRYLAGGKMHFAMAAEPSIPQALQGVIAGFRGLDDFKPVPRLFHVSPDFTSFGAHLLAPGDIATIYDLNPLYNSGIKGSGQTIVIPGQTDVTLSDIANFRELFGLPANNPKLMLFGSDPGLSLGDLPEADLDLELAGAVAPSATVIYAYSFDAFLSLQYAVDQNLGQVISLSYGACELDQPTGFRAVTQQANAQGITIIASAGDSGAASCDEGNPTPQASTGPTVDWPADFPEVTAVGGTEFNDGGGTYWSLRNGSTGGSALSYIPEVVWNDSAAENQLAAGGGGPSAMFAKPVWQTGPGVPADNARDLPDVAMAASPVDYPYLFVSQGEELYAGGTSGASPVFAGVVALLNQYLVSNGTLTTPGLGNINPALYRLAQAAPGAFHDIVSGNNAVPCVQSTTGCVDGMLGYSAGPGFDLASGLGSVDGFNLASHWSSGSAATTSLTISPSPAGVNDPVALTVAVNGTVKGAGATPTGSVAFVLDGVGALGAVTLATVNLSAGSAAGTASAAFSATGSQLAFGNGTLHALYSGDAVYESSQGSATFTLKPPGTSGSEAIPFATPNPVPESGDGQWQYSVGLTEAAGVATTLTSFSINGSPQNLSLWSSTSLPANGTIYAPYPPDANLTQVSLAPPVSLVFGFAGRDSSGRTWTQQLTVPFLAGSGTVVTPSISLITATPVVVQNPNAPVNCEWSQQLSVQETGGFLTLLDALLVNGANLPSEIQTTFGTTRLAPYGFLQGNLCLSGTGLVTIQLDGVSLSGQSTNAVNSSVTTSLKTPGATPTRWISPAAGASYNLEVADASGTPTPLSVPVSFSKGSTAWTVSVGPANPATNWLTASPLSGTGAGSVTVSASPAGLSPGAYTAVLTFAAEGAEPQVVNVSVTLTVGASSSTSIAGMVNNFSGALTAAPGMIAGVYGSQMAPEGTALVAEGLPLPLTLGGVSATVNGVAAPLYYVSPGQIDVQIPYETGAGTAVLAVNHNGQVATFAFPVAVTAPGLYSSAVSNSTGLGVSSAPAGETLLLFMTGEGDVTPTLATGATPDPADNPDQYPKPRLPVTVTVGGVAAKVLFQAIPYGLAGVTQIDFTIPSGALLGPQQVVVTVGGVAAPGVNLTVTAP
jgi:uncharacterized protein (TIGR03437 family)